jgi:hypothetical protein
MSGTAFFSCGGDKCPEGGEHVWDGPTKVFTRGCVHCEGEAEPDPNCKRCKGDPDWSYVSGEAATCSKCGLDAMSHSLMNGP